MNSALAITEADRAAFETVSKTIDYDALEDLHFLGSYRRELPVNIARMMENAYDWEHLPFVHPSAFAAIEKVDSGKWGWRAKVQLPPKETGEEQLLQLLVDHRNNYWATTVLSGAGKGVHIHTQAEAISEEAITVDVRFYVEQEPESEGMGKAGLTYLQSLYAQLYDEDQDLMQGRQEALNRAKQDNDPAPVELDLGEAAALQELLPHVFEMGDNRFCLNRVDGEWLVYGATCPHLLGPLDQGKIFTDGTFDGTPPQDFNGSLEISVIASDGEFTASATAQVRIDNPFEGWRQGTEGRDRLFGNFFRENEIYGRGGNDRIFGGFRRDYLAGGDGNDRIFGLWGNDHLWGNAGDDRLYGGFGTDTAYFSGTSSEYELQTQNGGFYVRIRDEEPNINGDDGRDQLFSIERLSFANGETLSIASPIILDLDGDGLEVVSAQESEALFDVDGDGVRDDTSWIGSGDAFLFIDRDGDGSVSGVEELSFVDDVENARSDLDGLRSFDSNEDGILSSGDERFADFGVWQDLNTDGEVDAGEIFTLGEAGVVSINLNAQATDAGFTMGDVAIVNIGGFERSDGSFSAYADAAITFFENGVPELPKVNFAPSSYSRKSKKYRLYAQNGELLIGGKKRAETSLSGANIMRFRNRNIGLLAPVVLDLDGNGVRLIDGAKTDAWFDMDGNGVADDTGWISSGDGFLVIDRNRNGLIDDGSELSFLADAPNAKSDLQALSIFDSNADGLLSAQDVRFGELKIWVDANSNGITDAGELRSLSEHGIESLNLTGNATNERVKVGKNITLANTIFTRTDGSTGQASDAVLSFTPYGDISATTNSNNLDKTAINGNSIGIMEDFNKKVMRFGKRGGEAGHEITSATSPYPELAALRLGLEDNMPTLTGQGLSFDVPQGVNIFDHFEQSVPPVATPLVEDLTASSVSEAGASNLPNMAAVAEASSDATDGSTNEVSRADLIAQETSGDNSMSLEQETGSDALAADSTDDQPAPAATQEAAALQSSGTEESVSDSDAENGADGEATDGPVKRSDLMVAEFQGGPEAVDPDILKISLMTQDMSTFGATSASESELDQRESGISPSDYLAG